MVRRKTLFINEKEEPRLLAYLLGCALANLVACLVNCYWMLWPMTWIVPTAATLLALFAVFSVETVFEGLAVTAIAALPLVLVLCLYPDYHVLKQVWLSATAGIGAGKIWVGMIR